MKIKFVLLFAVIVGCSTKGNQTTATSNSVRDASVTTTVPDSHSGGERLVQQTQEWWEPISVIDDGHGSVQKTWASQDAKIEYDRQQTMAKDLQKAAAPDDAVYVFDDTPNGIYNTIPRQDNGFQNKLGIEQRIMNQHSELMPQFHQIASDNASRPRRIHWVSIQRYSSLQSTLLERNGRIHPSSCGRIFDRSDCVLWKSKCRHRCAVGRNMDIVQRTTYPCESHGTDPDGFHRTVNNFAPSSEANSQRFELAVCRFPQRRREPPPICRSLAWKHLIDNESIADALFGQQVFR